MSHLGTFILYSVSFSVEFDNVIGRHFISDEIFDGGFDLRMFTADDIDTVVGGVSDGDTGLPFAGCLPVIPVNNNVTLI